MTDKSNDRKLREGVVVSRSGDKTVMVQIERLKRHKLYEKTYKQTTKFMAHDKTNAVKVGDVVIIKEIRPLSKRKKWLIESVVGKVS